MSFLCMLGFHKFEKILIATVIVHGKRHNIHGKICMRCGMTLPPEGSQYERIFGRK